MTNRHAIPDHASSNAADLADFAQEALNEQAESRSLPPGTVLPEEGQRVSFILNQAPDGSYYATDVRPA